MERLLLRALPLRRKPAPVRVGVMLLIVGIAFVLRLALDEPFDRYPFLFFFPAVFLCGLLFDRGTGYLATGLSTLLVAYAFTDPHGSFSIEAGDVAPIAIFVLVCIVMTSVTEALHKALEHARRAELEKNTLLREMIHRTKNDLQTVASILSLQAKTLNDPTARAAFSSAIGRVHVIARAHDRLQRDDHGRSVNMQEYLNDLCTDLGDTLRDVRPIAIRVEAQPIVVDTSVAVPIGLVVNELVTNAFKYAFPGDREGIVIVSLRALGADEAELEVQDNGVGCPDSISEGLGSKLVKLLVAQVNGTLAREMSNPGCRVRARFRLPLH